MSLVVTKVCQGVDLVPLWTCTFAVVKNQALSSSLVIFKPATRSCRLWEYLNSYPSKDLTSQGCWDPKSYAVFASNSVSMTQHQACSIINCYENSCWSHCQQNEDVNIGDQPKPIGWIGQTQLLWLSCPRVLGIPRYLSTLYGSHDCLTFSKIVAWSVCVCLLCVCCFGHWAWKTLVVW